MRARTRTRRPVPPILLRATIASTASPSNITGEPGASRLNDVSARLAARLSAAKLPAHPPRRDRDHGGAAALGRAGDSKRRGVSECAGRFAEIDDDQAKAASLEHELRSFDDRGLMARERSAAKRAYGRVARAIGDADGVVFVDAHSIRPSSTPAAAMLSGSKALAASSHAATSPRRVAKAANDAAIEVLPEPARPVISLIRPRGIPPSIRASSGASPELKRRSLRVSS